MKIRASLNVMFGTDPESGAATVSVSLVAHDGDVSMHWGPILVAAGQTLTVQPVAMISTDTTLSVLRPPGTQDVVQRRPHTIIA